MKIWVKGSVKANKENDQSLKEGMSQTVRDTCDTQLFRLEFPFLVLVSKKLIERVEAKYSASNVAREIYLSS